MEARKCGHGVGRVYPGECMFDFQSRASFVIRFRLPTAFWWHCSAERATYVPERHPAAHHDLSHT